MARFYAPSTIFIDEIDSLCGRRGDGSEHEASRRVKSEILVQMDGVQDTEDKQVIVIGATNFPWDLDDALRRRLEKRVYIPLPDEVGRRQLTEINLRGIKLSEDVSLDTLSQKFEGYSGADITSVCRDACFMSLRKRIYGLDLQSFEINLDDVEESPVTMEDFECALVNVQPSVGREEIIKYEQWMKEFGAV